MEIPRIGVFICRCGDVISRVLDVPELVAYAQTLPDVELVQDNVKSCEGDGRAGILQSIAANGLNRVVIASCSPRTHEPLFHEAFRRAGLNPYALELVNLREQCALVHRGRPEQATQKAKDLVRMAVFKTRLLEPLEAFSQPVVPAAMVIGAGVAGLTASLSLANRGFHVTLVEREQALGGLLRHVHHLYPTGDSGQAFVKEKASLVQDHPNITVLAGAQVRAVKGGVGKYSVTVTQGDGEQELTVGAIIVATGAQEFRPNGFYGYDGKTVITQGELEGLLARGLGSGDRPLHSVVMIQCVGARDEARPYCSRVCCMMAIKNATLLRERYPKPQVYVLYRDLLTLGTIYENLYREARGRGVTFIQYLPESPPTVDGHRVSVYDELLGETLNLPFDLLVLSTPLVGQPDAAGLAETLRVPVDKTGFFLEAHRKHRPLDFDTTGVFLCGSAYFPADVGESITQAYGAAARASVLLGAGKIEIEPTIARVNQAQCTACGLCEATCSYGAVHVTVVDQRRGKRAAQVDAFLCKGCGACVAGCRSRAIDLAGSTNEQILAMIEAF